VGRLQNADPPRPIRRRGAGARPRAARGPQRRLSRVGTATPWPPSPGRPAARLERDRGLASATSAHRERVRARPSPPRSAGDFDQAETDGRDALRVATPTGSRTGRAGRVDGARVGADRSRRLRRDRRPARHARPHARGGLLGPGARNLLVARSDLRRCEARFAEASHDARRAPEVVRPANPINRVFVSVPRSPPGSARWRWRSASGPSRRAGLHDDLGIALHSFGLARRGEGAIEVLREAGGVLGASPSRWEHTEALVDLGAALRRAGTAGRRVNRCGRASRRRSGSGRSPSPAGPARSWRRPVPARGVVRSGVGAPPASAGWRRSRPRA